MDFLLYRLVNSWPGNPPCAGRASFCLLERGSKIKALLAGWRELRKKKDWVTCGSDLFDWELILRAEARFAFLSEKAKERLF